MILIADAGNTKTAWAAVSLDRPAVLTTTDGISPYFDTSETIIHLAKEAAAKICTEDPSALFYFGSGCSKSEMINKVSKALESAFPGSKIITKDDLTGAGIALFGDGEGIVCISGTGSNAGIFQTGVMVKRAVTLGYLLGDEGSGSDIGFRFLKKLLSGFLNQELTDHFYHQYCSSPDDLLFRLYRAPKPQTFAASLVPFIAEHQHHSDIEPMICDSFRDMVEYLILPVAKAKRELPVGFCGSVPFYFRSLLETILENYKLKLGDVVKDPISALAEHFRKSPE